MIGFYPRIPLWVDWNTWMDHLLLHPHLPLHHGDLSGWKIEFVWRR